MLKKDRKATKRMSELSNLRAPKGATKKRKRVGRGESSGHGKTSGKGHKGQKARTGGKVSPQFEGGQMPFIRRFPKRGFTNPFRTEYAVINVGELNDKFQSGETINSETLKKKRLIKDLKSGLKVLGDGELKIALTVEAHKFSQTAKEKIEKAGGKAVEITRLTSVAEEKAEG
ncbi:MAG: 50S ribosomal protein L15 [Myxococcota bacterium]